MPGLTDRTALVTGAARGISATLARLDAASEGDGSRIVTGLAPRADAPLPPHDPKHAASPTDRRCTR